MARAIDKQPMLDLIIEAKRTDPETGSFAEWLAEYLVERLPTLTPPNEPLTLDELREMEAPTPVWWGRMNIWCLCKRGFITTPNRNTYAVEETGGAFYRRPPERQEGT